MIKKYLDSSAQTKLTNPIVCERIQLILLGETGLVPELREFNPGCHSGKNYVFFYINLEVIDEVTAIYVSRQFAHCLGLPHIAQELTGIH